MTTPTFAGYTDAVLVGQGGLGRVYRAKRVSTGGVVAIKELPDVASASSAWHRANRELEALLRLKGHAGVVSVEEIFEGLNGPCIVMEFMPGGSLNDRLRSGPLSVPEAVLVGQQVSQALRAAHEVGIVHRDVKPHNLMINGFGHVKVCDFGISALNRGEGGRTQTHALTLAYASPEELDGSQTVGPAADVYSFGATMQHLITGHKPSFQERMRAPVPSPNGQPTDPVMSGVNDALSLAMANHPADRPTMNQLAVVFESASTALGTHRLSRLQTGTTVADLTEKRAPSTAPPLILAAPIVAVRPPPPMAGPAQPSRPYPDLPRPFQPTDAAVARFDSPPANNNTQVTPTTVFDGAQDVRGVRRRRPAWLFAAVLVAALATVAVSVFVVRRSQNNESLAATTTELQSGAVAARAARQPSAAATATPSAPPTQPATFAAPVTTTLAPLVALVPETAATTVPLVAAPVTQPPILETAAPQTVLVSVAPQIVVVTVVVPATDPQTASAPAVSGSEASQLLAQFYSLIANQQYSDAWNLESAVGQSKSANFDGFSKFFGGFTSVTLVRTSVVGAIAGGIEMSIDVRFVRPDGSSEVDRINVNVVRSGSAALIDAQNFVKKVSG